MATSYVALIRGINVGGNNPLSMADLAECFRDAGYADVRTHGQSGNVLFATDATPSPTLETQLERLLKKRFELPALVVVRSRDELADTISAAPPDHGSSDLRSEVIFLTSPLTAKEAFAAVPELRQGVDSIAVGPGALYFSRVKARATKTRIQKFMGMPIFQRMTMRTWSTVNKLLAMLDEE